MRIAGQPWHGLQGGGIGTPIIFRTWPAATQTGAPDRRSGKACTAAYQRVPFAKRHQLARERDAPLIIDPAEVRLALPGPERELDL